MQFVLGRSIAAKSALRVLIVSGGGDPRSSCKEGDRLRPAAASDASGIAA
jgi:hypothetical protein